MKLTKISNSEFDGFTLNHPLANFHQTTQWADLKEKSGWKKHVLGLIDNDKIVATTIILEKPTPFKKSIFYAPRGFICDYHNKEVLTNFTSEIKKYIKENKGIFLKIDPYLIHKERNHLGDIVEGGIDNSEVVDTLKSLNYKHFGFNIYQETMQPRWIYTVNINNRNANQILSDMKINTRNLIRKNEKSSIICREIGYDELEKFQDIMKSTGDRREFIGRPLKYYQNMFLSLKENNSIKILFAELHADKFLNSLQEELRASKKEIQDNIAKKESGSQKFNEAKFNNRQKDLAKNVKRVSNKIIEVNNLIEKHGKVIILSGVLFLINKNEVVALYGGTYKEFMYLQSPYALHFEMIKYAQEHHCQRYNFYGITGDFDEKNPMYGLYLFKTGFGGEVVELIGEFDLVINKVYYYLYKISYGIYHNLKKIRNKLRR